ncbi:hypothetical protein PTTG_08822, partial [Puccinia triticina 1-1 BBBD Race 1]
MLHRHPGKPIPFCKCTPDVVRLIHYGYFACLAEAPCTAFSIQLVQYHHHLWQATAVSASGFLESLSSFLDTCTDTPLLNRGSTHKRSLERNFQQQHYADASKDNPREEQYPESFNPSFKDCEQHGGFECIRTCGSRNQYQHKAADDTRNGSTWEKCDNNGLFASTCRHDVPLLMINIYKTGEKLYYPISIIQNILADFPDSKVGVLCDIGCHLEAQIIKRGLLSDLLSDVKFATSVFHAYAHEWACQVKYNPCFNEMWGLTDGEGLKRFWLYMSPLVSYLRVSTRLHRLLSLQSLADYFLELLMGTTGDWLIRKLNNAEETLQLASDALQLLYSTLNPATPGVVYTSSFLEEQWTLKKSFHANFNQRREDQRKKLGELLCLQDDLDEA